MIERVVLIMHLSTERAGVVSLSTMIYVATTSSIVRIPILPFNVFRNQSLYPVRRPFQDSISFGNFIICLLYRLDWAFDRANLSVLSHFSRGATDVGKTQEFATRKVVLGHPVCARFYDNLMRE